MSVKKIFKIIQLLIETKESLSAEDILKKLKGGSKPQLYRDIKTIRELGFEIAVNEQKKYILNNIPDFLKKSSVLSKKLKLADERIDLLLRKDITEITKENIDKLLYYMKHRYVSLIDYKSPNFEKVVTYKVLVFHLYWNRGATYAAVFDINDNKMKEFRVDRIKKIATTNQVRSNYRDIHYDKVEFIVSKKLAPYYDHGRFFNCEHKKLKDGSLHVTAGSPGTYYALRELLSLGSEVTILGPEEFKAEYNNTIKRILQKK